MVTRGRRDALKKIHGGKERRRYKAMTIMAVESAADVRHRGRRGAGGGNLIILRAFSLATFKQLQRIFSARPSRCLYPLPPCSGSPSYGAKREDNPPGLSGYFEREGREGRKISFSSFFFRSLEKKMEKDSSPSLSRRDRIGLFKGALSIPTSNRLVSPLVGEGLQGGEHCGD